MDIHRTLIAFADIIIIRDHNTTDNHVKSLIIPLANK